MSEQFFPQNHERGNVGEAFVQKHLSDLTGDIILNLEDRAGEHVEGGDTAGRVIHIGAPITNAIPDFVDAPGMHEATAYEIDAFEAGGNEVKTVWNFLFRTNDHEEPSGSLGFALWSNERREQYGWLMKILRPEAFNEPGQRVRAVRPLCLIFLLVEYEDVFACVAFKDVSALCDRLRDLAHEYGFDLDDGVPLGEQALEWNPEQVLIIDNMCYLPLSKLADLATVTMIGNKPRLRDDIKLGNNVCRVLTQNKRYSYLKKLAAGMKISADEQFAGAFTPARGQEVFADIDYNLKVLDDLDADRYSALSKYSHKRVFQHLKELMCCMLSFPFPSWPENNPRFFAISNAFFQKMAAGSSCVRQ